MLSTLLARQLKQPSGFIGYMAGRWMNTFNRQMMMDAVEQLNIFPQHIVLEIGFGGGEALKFMADRANKGVVAGIDISDAMLRRVQRAYDARIKQGRMIIRKGCIEEIPFPGDSFDGICTINTIYFWSDLSGAISEIYRTLKPGGAMVIAFRPSADMKGLEIARHGFKLYDGATVVHAVERAGFTNLNIQECRDAHLGYLLVAAMKAAPNINAITG